MGADRNARRPDQGTTYDVRIWKLRTYEGRRGKTYSVRWTVAGEEHHKTYKKRALADARRSELLTATRQGTRFDVATGLPVTELRQQKDTSWYEHACTFADMKWNHVAGKSRRSIADALATVTPALLATDRGRPTPEALREALYGWAFNSRSRMSSAPPEHLAKTVTWIERNTLKLSALSDSSVLRDALDMLAVKLDGSPASPNTIARKRAVFYNTLEYAVELEAFDTNPLARVNWKPSKVAEIVNPRVVVDPDRAVALLNAVGARKDAGRHLKAFFGCMYYAALRPAEAAALREEALDLPEEGWGWLHLSASVPSTGASWSDSGGTFDTRQLKHRARKDTRDVPCPPPLTRLLHQHLAAHRTASDGRLFRGRHGNPVPESVYGDVWREARQTALKPAEVASPLARRPYDLRHACVSLWLNAGVPATQVAEWAGHSAQVLWRVYAKCVLGQEEAAKRRIETALKLS